MAKKKKSKVKTLRQVQEATLADVKRATEKHPIAASGRKGLQKHVKVGQRQVIHWSLMGEAT